MTVAIPVPISCKSVIEEPAGQGCVFGQLLNGSGEGIEKRLIVAGTSFPFEIFLEA